MIEDGTPRSIQSWRTLAPSGPLRNELRMSQGSPLVLAPVAVPMSTVADEIGEYSSPTLGARTARLYPPRMRSGSLMRQFRSAL
ncbi:hypothetical protein D3C87_1717670 [compost metagenome]